jgi:mannose-6-phosphate isomerase-like protein (cupin superfamily)
MQTRRLPASPDAIAPDGSEVRILVRLAGGSLAHFALPPGRTSRAVRHRTVEELWYFVGGRGRMWRRDKDGRECVVDVAPGVSLDIPLGTTFQFRSIGDEPLAAVGTTMPPWPDDDEAVPADGPWEPN